MTLKTEEDIFFVDYVFCILKKELMKYVVLEYVCMHLSCITLFYLYILVRFSTKHTAKETCICTTRAENLVVLKDKQVPIRGSRNRA